MKTSRFMQRARGFQVAGVAAALCTAFSFADAAFAATRIEVWHALNPHNTKVFEDIVKQYNRKQDEVEVALKRFASSNEIEDTLAKQAKAKGQDVPHLVQLEDNRSPEELAGRPYIQPLYTLLAKHPLKQADWFVASDSGLLRDSKGRMLAFPYMMQVPVMYYNTEAFKKAGISPAVPDRSWSGLQGQLVDLANKATRHCPAANDQPASLNLENLAAVNNQFFTGNKSASPTFSFDVVYVRHLALMISWVRSELLIKPGTEDQAARRFASGECAVLLSDSSNLGWFQSQRGLSFGLSGLPYYPEVTRQPGSPFIDGAALWLTANHSKADEAATASFLAWLADPAQAAKWYQNTGFLPLTKQAFNATEPSYYKDLGQWQKLAGIYSQQQAATTRAFKVRNYPKIRAMFHETMQTALDGKLPAMTALSEASMNANRLMREK